MNARWHGITPLMIASMVTAISPAMAQKSAKAGTRDQLAASGYSVPARDSRGNIVISNPAVAPPGSNLPAGSAVTNGDPRVIFAPRPTTKKYRVCSKNVTDDCVQSWEAPGDLPNCPGDPECPTLVYRPQE